MADGEKTGSRHVIWRLPGAILNTEKALGTRSVEIKVKIKVIYGHLMKTIQVIAGHSSVPYSLAVKSINYNKHLKCALYFMACWPTRQMA